jgi:glycosyltransferase involved in cell wall biosynthesis
MIDYEVKERMSGTTKWSFIKLFKYAFEGICSFSHTPLLFPIIMGIIETISSFAMLLFALVGIVFTLPLPIKDIAFFAMILFFIGMQSFSIGIMGQYIAKIHTETLNRPIYVVKNTLKKD